MKNKTTQSESVTSSERALYIFSGIVSVALYYMNNQILVLTVSIFVLLVFSYRHNDRVLILYIIISSLGGAHLAGYYQVTLLAFAILGMLPRGFRFRKDSYIFSTSVFVVVLISYMFGEETDIKIASLAVLSILLFTFISTKSNGTLLLKRVTHGYVLVAVFTTIVVLVEYLQGGEIYKYGRISFEGSIRILANIYAIPLILIIMQMINKLSDNTVFSNKKCIDIVVCALLAAGLFMTLSRGALVAVIVGVAISLLLSERNKTLKIVLVVSVAALIYYLLHDNGELHISHLFDDDGTMGGRVDIWKFYYDNLINSNIIRTIFGFGPGDIKRIASGTLYNNMYAHSTFLDIVFTYGVCGILIVIGLLISSIKNVLASKSKGLTSILISVILLYSTHGTVANFDMYIIIATIIAASKHIQMQRQGRI